MSEDVWPPASSNRADADAEQFFMEHRPTMRDFVELVNRYVH